MSVTVRVPTTLRTLTGGESEVAVAGDTVGEVLSALEIAHPGFRERILDENGKLRRFVNVFVSDDDIRFLDGLSTKVPDAPSHSKRSRVAVPLVSWPPNTTSRWRSTSKALAW